MMLQRSVLSVLLFFATVATTVAQETPPTPGTDLKGYMPAAATVDAFIKGMREGDLEAVMKTVDVPWFQDGTKILKTREELRELLAEPIREEEVRDLTAEIDKVQRFASLRDQASGTAGELLKQVARDDDLVFQMKVDVRGRSDGMMLLVRVKDDSAKIIGLRD